MESFAPSAAAAVDPSQASLDQASFTEMFHSSPAATPPAARPLVRGFEIPQANSPHEI